MSSIQKSILIQKHINEVLEKIKTLPVLFSNDDKKNMIIWHLNIEQGICVDSQVEKIIQQAI